MKNLTERENEIIYFALSRLLDNAEQFEFKELDTLRDKFKEDEKPTNPLMTEDEMELHNVGSNFETIIIPKSLKEFLLDHNLIHFDELNYRFFDEDIDEIIKIKNACK